MIEVFRTNVKDQEQAIMLIDRIHETFHHYKANFDLDDCDNILRVKSATGCIESCELIDLLRQFGYNAEVLPDEWNMKPHQQLQVHN